MFKFKISFVSLLSFVFFGTLASATEQANRVAVGAVNGCSSAVVAAAPYTLESPAQIGHAARTNGYWIPAPPHLLESIQKAYRASGLKLLENGKWHHEVSGEYEPSEWNLRNIRRARSTDMGAWSSGPNLLPAERTAHIKRALNAAAKKAPASAAADLEVLGLHGYKGFFPQAYVTSGAGSWSRGGRQVKALVPLNLHACLGVHWTELETLTTFIAADRAGRMKMQQAALDGGSIYSSHLQGDLVAISEKIRHWMEVGRGHVSAITPLDMKMIQAAVLSKVTGTYVHLDIGTSRQTHEPISNALKEFAKNYSTRRFLTDSTLNRKIIEALRQYIGASDALGETHILGYQEEVYPFNVFEESLPSVTSEDANGIGAGTTYHALHRTHRAETYTKRGVLHWRFDNIEVTGLDPLVQYGAHLALKKTVSAILIEETDNVSGGYGFVDETDASFVRHLLIEGAGLPAKFKKPDPKNRGYFNTNSITGDVNGLIFPEDLDFEIKIGRQGQLLVLPKQSLGVITYDNRTGFIGGQLGTDYQHLKKLSDYRDLGDRVVEDYWQAIGNLFALGL